MELTLIEPTLLGSVPERETLTCIASELTYLAILLVFYSKLFIDFAQSLIGLQRKILVQSRLVTVEGVCLRYVHFQIIYCSEASSATVL